MPIRPENRARYPADWKAISRRIRFERARSRCECPGGEEGCGLHRGRRCTERHGEAARRLRLHALREEREGDREDPVGDEPDERRRHRAPGTERGEGRGQSGGDRIGRGRARDGAEPAQALIREQLRPMAEAVAA